MNAINWFEIPAANFKRAVAFYEQIMAAKLPIEDSFPGMKMAMFPYNDQFSSTRAWQEMIDRLQPLRGFQLHGQGDQRMAQRIVQIPRQAPSLIVPDLQQAPTQAAHSGLSSLEPGDVLDNDPHLGHDITIFRNGEERLKPPSGHAWGRGHRPPDLLGKQRLAGAGDLAKQRLNLVGKVGNH